MVALSESAVAIISFFVVGTAIGVLTNYAILVTSFPIPYPVVIFFEGIVFAAVAIAIDANSVNHIEDSAVASDLIIYVFLPGILFGEMKNLNWSHVKGAVDKALLLAGPGAFVAALITASCFQNIWAGPGMSWNNIGVPDGIYIYYVLGSILCATDPVSMVALLKNLGASSELTMVIVGESLLNDASAMILFFFFKTIVVTGKIYSVQSFLLFCAQKLVLSPIVGIVLALMSLHLMKKIKDDWNIADISIHVVISLVCGYMSFFLGEYEFGNSNLINGSGVLSVCGAGCIFAWLCPPQILTHRIMIEVWHHLEWGCNTLIFLLGGVIAGGRTMRNAPASQYGYLLALYFLVQGVRFVMVGSCYPALRRCFSMCETGFIMFCGIRGALAIALALQFKQELSILGNAFDDGGITNSYGQIGNQFYFFISGLVALTLLINGSLGEVFLKGLKIIEDPNKPKSPQLQMVLQNVQRAIRRQVRDEMELLAEELGLYDSEEVVRLCRMMRASKEKTEDFSYQPSVRDIDEKISPDLLGYVRRTFLETVRAHYWECIHNGTIGTQSSAAQLLLYSIDKGLDSCDDPEAELGDWPCIERNAMVKSWVFTIAKFFDDLFAHCGLYPGNVAYIDAMIERRAIYVLTNFIEAHMTAQSKLHIFLGAPEKETGQWLPEEKNVMMHSEKSIERAKALLETLDPKYLSEFFKYRTARTVLLRQKEIIEIMVKEGALSAKWGAAMLATIDDDEVRVDVERESSHRAMLREMTKEKIIQDKDIRLSTRSSMTSDAPRDSVAMQQRQQRPSFRDSLAERPSMGTQFNEAFSERMSESVRPSFHQPGIRPSVTLRPSIAAGPNGYMERPSILERPSTSTQQGVATPTATVEV